MMQQKRLSIFSPMRGGKDTVAAEIMSKHFDRECVKLAYGDKLKEMYHGIFGHNGSKKDRDGYQWFGQAMRARQGDIWIQNVEPLLQYNLAKNNHVIFTDMRQPNEYEHLKANDFVMIKVDTPLDIRIERMKAAGEEVREEFLTHETESHMDSFQYDYIIHNDSTLENLHRQVYNVMRAIEGGYGNVR
jgi:dephospho-CoA kinase